MGLTLLAHPRRTDDKPMVGTTEEEEEVVEVLEEEWRCSRSIVDRYSDWAVEALQELPGNFLITDPTLPGHPIVFASRGFLDMSGYGAGDVLGRNANIFQGPGTCRRAVAVVREAIRSEAPVEVALLNYRRDGSPLRILFQLCPVFGRDDGQVAHFVGVQVPITGSRHRRRPGGGALALLSGSCRRELCFDNGGLELDPYADSDSRGWSKKSVAFLSLNCFFISYNIWLHQIWIELVIAFFTPTVSHLLVAC